MIGQNVSNWNLSHVKVSFHLLVQVDGECRLVKLLQGSFWEEINNIVGRFDILYLKLTTCD